MHLFLHLGVWALLAGARVVQHECDHLDGVLFPDRLHTPQSFGFIPELEQSGMIPMVPS